MISNHLAQRLRDRMSLTRSGIQGALASLVLACVLLTLPQDLAAQVIPDTLPPLPDTLAQGQDTLALQEAVGDTINPQDTLPAAQLPPLIHPLPAGWSTGVWEWDREALLGTRAMTLPQLLAEVPGVILVRGGDIGNPVGVSSFGASGERIRVFRDGVEMLPLEGSVVDLGRVGLAGLRSVRVSRSMGELRIELESVFTEGGTPYSLVEAATGDLGTNILRGTFIHPRALGGVIDLAIERSGTEGPRGQEPGSTQSGWLRYTRELWGRGIVSLDYLAESSDRDDRFSPSKASRADWSAKTRWTLYRGVVGGLYYASSSLSTEKPDTFDFELQKRTQLGASLSLDSEFLRALGRFDRVTGDGLPSATADIEVEAPVGRFGGAAAELGWQRWDDRSVTQHRVRAWTAPLFGLSFFGETGSGDWGLPFLPAREIIPPDSAESQEGAQPAEPSASVIPGPRFSGASGSRIGVEFGWRGLHLGGARLHAETDSLFVLGLPSDRSGSTLPGGKRDGFELSGRIPVYPRGTALLGTYQWWDEPETVWAIPPGAPDGPEPLPESKVPWRYLPHRSYQASVSFHDTFLPTGNLEVWFDLGARGRDPMVVPFLEEVSTGTQGAVTVPTTVPFYQSWFMRLQIRVVTVRAFIMWENFTIRENNQDLPGRLLPATRSLYGVRWTMRN